MGVPENREKFPFAESFINKGKHQNFKKKHLLIHLETSSENLYLWEFQRTRKKNQFLENLINKGKQANHKKKHLVNHLETGEAMVGAIATTANAKHLRE